MKLALAILWLLASAQAGADTLPEQAKREGEVAWYTSMNVSDVESVLRPFRQRYPFLEVNLLRAAPEKVRNNMLADAQEGRYTWDVVSFSIGDVDALSRAGILATYSSPESRSGFRPGLVDPAGRWAAIYVLHYVIGYNTRLVAAADAPRTWNDLLAPRWKGALALDDSDADWYAAMLDYWGREKGLAFMRALARQKPQRLSGHEAMAHQLAAGEFPLVLNHMNQLEKMRQAGAPVQWVRTLDPVIALPIDAAISAKAPHPAAARLLVDYLLSKEGQRAIAARGRVPARSDIPEGDVARQLKVHFVDSRVVPKLPVFAAEFRRTLAAGN